MRISDWSSDVCSSDLSNPRVTGTYCPQIRWTDTASLVFGPMLECDGFMPRQPAFEKICLPCPETRLSTHLPNYRRSDAGDFRWSKFNFRFSLGTRIMLPSQTDNSEETAQMRSEERREGKECDSTGRSR